MKTKVKEILETLQPFRNIIWFLFLFISIDFLWKICVNEGDEGEIFMVFGKDFTDAIYPICIWTAEISHWIIQNVFGHKDLVIDADMIYFENNIHFKIIWGCTGIKQMIMFGLLILLYFGPCKKKLWFIPLTMLILNLINILRIVAVVIITKDGYPDWFIGFNEWYNNIVWDSSVKTDWRFRIDWFELFHKDIFRWLYYNGVMFLLWLWWEEKSNLPYQKTREKSEGKEKELLQ